MTLSVMSFITFYLNARITATHLYFSDRIFVTTKHMTIAGRLSTGIVVVITKLDNVL